MTKKTSNNTSKRVRVTNKHRRVHKSFGSLALLLWIFVIVVTAAMSIDYFKKHREISINRSGISLTITDVSYDEKGSYPFEAPSGWKFVIVKTTVKNEASENFDFAPVLQTYLTDSSGTKYEMSPATLSDPISAGKIHPGMTNSGSLSYLVPLSAKDVTIHFQP